jgi:hypothetical protein
MAAEEMKPIVIIYNYQNLIAGSLALLGAIWTVSAIKKQIKQTDDQERERRERKHLVAQAMASNALSQLSHYAERWTPPRTVFLGRYPAQFGCEVRGRWSIG